MSHYAKVLNGKVVQVIVAEQEFFNTFVDTSPGNWIQTSYNTRGNVHYGSDGQPDGGIALRANYAGIDYTYDATNDVFYAPQPYPSWTLNEESWRWIPPVAIPSDNGLGNPPKMYLWDESIKNWIAQ